MRPKTAGSEIGDSVSVSGRSTASKLRSKPPPSASGRSARSTVHKSEHKSSSKSVSSHSDNVKGRRSSAALQKSAAAKEASDPGDLKEATEARLAALPTVEDLPRARRDVEIWVNDILDMLKEAVAEGMATRNAVATLTAEKEQIHFKMERAVAEADIGNAARRLAEEAHHKELDSVEAQLLKAMQERSQLRAQNSEMTMAEAQLIDLHLEMTDRHGLPPLPAEELERQRAELSKQSPLTVVGMLRANLVSLRDFKRSCEGEVRKVQNRQMAEESDRVHSLEKEVAELRATVDRARHDLADAKARTKVAEQRQQWTLEESRKMVAEANDERLKMAEMVQAREDELRLTQGALDTTQTEARKRDNNVLKVIELEVSRERDISSFREDLKKYTVEITALKKELKEIGSINASLMASKAKLERQLKEEIAKGRQAESLEKELRKKDRLLELAAQREASPHRNDDRNDAASDDGEVPLLDHPDFRPLSSLKPPATPGGAARDEASPKPKTTGSTRSKEAFGLMAKGYKGRPLGKVDTMSKREKGMKERQEIDEGLRRIKLGEAEKKSIMSDFRKVMAAGDRRMILPSWEEVENGTAHQDETLKLDDLGD